MAEAQKFELTPAQYEEYQRLQKLATTVYDDPDLRNGVRGHIKKMFPDQRLPDDAIEPALEPLRKQGKSIEETLAKLNERLDQRDKKVEEDQKAAEEAEFEKRLQDARVKYSLTDDGFEKMVARMKETKNYTDPHAAAAYILSQNPPPPPPGPMYGSGDIMNPIASADENYKDLLSGARGPEKHLENHIRLAFGPQGRDYVASILGDEAARSAFGA